MGCLAVRGNPQFISNGAEYFLPGKGWIGQVEGFDIFRQAFQQHPAKHGLATADFAAYLDNAFVLRDCVDEGVERWPPVGAGKKEIGVRRDAKRWLA